MYMVRLVLMSQAHPHPVQADADSVRDTVWAHAQDHDGLEHVRTRAGPGRIDLVLFLRSPRRPTPHLGPPLAVLVRLVAPLDGWRAEFPVDPGVVE
jgi:hypothetical protein